MYGSDTVPWPPVTPAVIHQVIGVWLGDAPGVRLFGTNPYDCNASTRQPGGNAFDWEPAGHHHCDLDPVEERFLMIEQERSVPDRIHVVLNWFDEL